MGKGLVDKSLFFGIQNFMACATDEDGAIYNYYGFNNRKGSVLIMRTDKDTTEIKYWVGRADFDTAFADRENKNYKYPAELADPQI